ncbi:BGTF surface domain-containing protein [Halosimplex aquaticum]|uniref:BGTF surface domain-containing protein n=1 Tax=Halosimplex aquaticum TaxID=3026162 RepID=A0ABD5Y5C9_9EURY|nr:BGTF surface domain-containing protein [Halosimplex aquaticum]
MTARRLLAALAVAALLTAPMAGAVAAGEAAPSFADDGYEVAQGETAEIAIDMNGTDTARFTVGDAEEVNFEVRGTVTDTDGDGTVTVRFDTGAAHESGPASYLTAAGDDVIENRTEVDGVDQLLNRAPYGLRLGDPGDPAATATLSVLSEGSRHLDDETPTDTATPTDGATATHDGTTLDTTDGEVRVAPEAGQTISGETTLDAGTPISIRVVSDSPSSPFLVTAETTVADDGTFEGTFDFSDMSSGTPIDVSVRTDDRRLAASPGQIVDCETDCPTGTATSGGSDGETATPTPLATDEIRVHDINRVDQGAVARIPVTFGDADALTITIGDQEAVNYETTASIRDTNGDGRAVVLFRTNATADADRPALAVAEAGETRPANVTSETTLDSVLDPAPYSVDVFSGPDADGNPATVGTIVVQAGDGGGEQSGDSGSDGDETATDDEPPGPGDATVAADDSGSSSFLTGVGALALGGLLAFGAIAMFLGFVRS